MTNGEHSQSPGKEKYPDTWRNTPRTEDIAFDANEHLGADATPDESDFEINAAAMIHDTGQGEAFENISEQRRRDVAGVILPPEAHEERRALESALATDRLTGVGSRGAFDVAEERLMEDPNIRVAVFDANNFKGVNEELGHIAGDAALKEIAIAIRAAAEAKGHGRYVFRYGGDEFVVFAPADEIDEIVADASAQFDARLARDEPLEITVQTKEGTFQHSYATSQLRDLEVSITGTTGSNFTEADGILKSAKEERKARDAIQRATSDSGDPDVGVE